MPDSSQGASGVTSGRSGSESMLDTDVKSISVDKDLNYYTNPWW